MWSSLKKVHSMNSLAQTTPAVATVTFHGHDLITLQHEGETFAALRPIVEAISIDWKSQYNRIQRDDVLKSTVVIMTTVAADGKNRELVCLPLKYLNGWLFGIDTARIKRPISEWVIHTDESLRIIEQSVWDAVKSRQTRTRTDITRRAANSRGAGKSRYLFSGLLKCACCGSAYIIVNAERYGCALHKSGGSSACANSVTVKRSTV
ncbi:MAG TPA: hypothetical protein ENO09_08715, partial [bacterium]|nr:hypothetical protein [bacterium]